MTTTTAPPVTTSSMSVVVHGTHPLRGYAVTWRLTPLPVRHGAGVEFLVERADGHIEDQAVWELAEKDVVVLDTHAACELVRRATPRVG